MHFGVNRDAASLTNDLPAFGGKRRASTKPARSSEEILQEGNAVFESDFVSRGYRNDELIALTDSSLIFKASTDWFQGAVAVKLFHSELLESRFAQKIFLQEAATLLELNHPGIAPLYHYGIASNGAPYLVSQFVPGTSLLELNKRGMKIEPVSLFAQICEALVFAHSQNVIHGRLGASKIVASAVQQDAFVAKVIDFSICAALRAQLPFTLAALRPSVSPEELYGQDPDKRSDIFSLGYLMYEMLSGSRPVFNRENQVIGFSPLRGVLQDLEPLVTKCLAYEAKDRYQSASELLNDLRELELKLL